MKLFFYSNHQKLESLSKSIDWSPVLCSSNEEDILNAIELCLAEELTPLVLIDFDFDLQAAHRLNEGLTQNERVIRVIATSKLSVSDLKEHQTGPLAAHAYIKMPVTNQILKSIVSDLDISEYIESNSLYEEGTGFPLKELELNKSGSFSFNRELDTQVNLMMDAHEIGSADQNFQSLTNDLIQSQFDKVFGENSLKDLDKTDDDISLDLDLGLDTPQESSNDLEISLDSEGEDADNKVLYPSAEDLEFPNSGEFTGETQISSMSLESNTSNVDDSDDFEIDLDSNSQFDEGTDLEIDLGDEEEGGLELSDSSVEHTEEIDIDVPSQINDEISLELGAGEQTDWNITDEPSVDPTKETFQFEVSPQEEEGIPSVSDLVDEDDEDEAYDFQFDGAETEEKGQEESFEISLDGDEEEGLEVSLDEEGDSEGLEISLADEESVEPVSEEEEVLMASSESESSELSDELNIDEEVSIAHEQPVQAVSVQAPEPSGEYRPRAFDQEENLRFQSLIGDLRDERADLLSQINREKTENQVLAREILSLKAELEETKIELSIVRNRHQKDLEMLGQAAEMAVERQRVAEEKYKHLHREFDLVEERVRSDLSQVKTREKELESQLELAKMDGQSQVELRDKKILELKRQIDQLEFNMENSVIKEQKSRDDRYKVEQKLEKIMRTLRGSIELLEDDLLEELNASENNEEA